MYVCLTNKKSIWVTKNNKKYKTNADVKSFIAYVYIYIDSFLRELIWIHLC